MDKVTLYGKDKNGGLKQWSVWTVDEKLFIEHGKVGGKLQLKEEVVEGKNKGRSNETSGSQQAELEAKSRINKQIDRGYREDPDDLQELEIMPMLAHDYLKQGHRIKYPCYGSPKMDGCFSRDALVTTNKGLVPIGKIVDEKLKLKALSYNETTKKFEFKNIVNYFNNGSKSGYNFKGVNSSKITGNHKIYVNGEWKRFDESGTISKIDNKYLMSVVIGMLLGDSSPSIEKRHDSYTIRLTWSNSEQDRCYGERKAEMFKDICNVKEREYVSGFGSRMFNFTTQTLNSKGAEFWHTHMFGERFEDENYGKRKKDLELKDISPYFTDLSLAIWYLDDGSIQNNNGNEDTPRLHFSVPRYSEKTHNVFKALFRVKYGFEPTIAKYGKDVRMSFSSAQSIYLLWRMAKAGGAYLMPRKFPESLRFDIQPAPIQECGLIEEEYERSECSARFVSYDIEVEDNHNYICNGVLVHNCRALAIRHKDSVELKSRGGKQYTIPHIQDQLMLVMKEGDMYDGEIYIHGKYLEEIVSAVKKSNGLTPELQYVIFDVVNDSPYEDRATELMRLRRNVLDPDSSVRVLQFIEVANEGHMKIWHDNYVEDGFEGICLRNFAGKYESGKRSADLQKYKQFIEEEFQIVAVGKDKNDNAVLCVFDPIATETFTVCYGDFEQRKHQLEFWQDYIGKWLTVKFQTRYKDSKLPQFPTGVRIRDCNEKGEPLE